MTLLTDTREVLLSARDSLQGSPAEAEVQSLIDRLDGPLRVAIAGRVKAGKSTLLNALVGSHLAPTDARECTRIVTWYRNGSTYGASATLRDGSEEKLAFAFEGTDFAVSLGHLSLEQISQISVEWPSRELAKTTLIDTPGVGSMTPDAEARSTEFLGANNDEAQADAVLYLMKHLHGSDMDLLSAFHDEEVSHPNPINAIGVLSRADEVGAGRLDAMDSARLVAARIAGEPAVRRLVSTVIPVCGLLAETAATLTEDDFRQLSRLAALSVDDRRSALLTADRFREFTEVSGLHEEHREQLLGRFAMFGLRTAVAAIAGGAAPTSSDLARLLMRISGVDDLRRLLDSVFSERGEVLKSRSALVGLSGVLARSAGAGSDDTNRRVEQILASAHEIEELRALGSIRVGAISAKPEVLAEAERLLGGAGLSPTWRLALSDASSNEQLIAETQRLLAAWQRRAEHPLSDAALVSLSRVVIRSCEGLMSVLLAETNPDSGSGTTGATPQ